MLSNTTGELVTEGSSSGAKRSAHRTILLVEDEEAVRNVLVRYLTGKGFRVLAAADARLAAPIWEDHQRDIDLLITDLTLPHGVSGSELAARLQAEKPGLYVILNSGYSAACSPVPDLTTLRTQFIAKPYRPQQLLDMIQRVFAAHPQG